MLIDELLYIEDGIADAFWKQSIAILLRRQAGQEIIHVSGMFLSGSAANTWHKSDNRTRQMEETIVITVSYRIAHEINASQESTAQ